MADFIVGAVKTARASYVGADNLPADVQGDGVWSVTPLDAVTFGPGPDRLSRLVTMGGPATGFVITAAYDVDLRDGAEFVKDLAIMSESHNIIVPEATGGTVTLE